MVTDKRVTQTQNANRIDRSQAETFSRNTPHSPQGMDIFRFPHGVSVFNRTPNAIRSMKAGVPPQPCTRMYACTQSFTSPTKPSRKSAASAPSSTDSSPAKSTAEASSETSSSDHSSPPTDPRKEDSTAE